MRSCAADSPAAANASANPARGAGAFFRTRSSACAPGPGRGPQTPVLRLARREAAKKHPDVDILLRVTRMARAIRGRAARRALR